MFLVCLPEPCGHEPCIVVQNALHFGIVENGVILQGKAGVQVTAFYAGLFQVLQMGHDLDGFAGSLCREEIIAVLDQLQCTVRGHDFALIDFLNSFHGKFLSLSSDRL